MKYVCALILAILLTATATAQNYTVEFERVFENGDKFTNIEPAVTPDGILTHLTIAARFWDSLVVMELESDKVYKYQIGWGTVKTYSSPNSERILESIYLINGYSLGKLRHLIGSGRNAIMHENTVPIISPLSYSELVFKSIDLLPVITTDGKSALHLELLAEYEAYESTMGPYGGYFNLAIEFSMDSMTLIKLENYATIKSGDLSGDSGLETCRYYNEYNWSRFCDWYQDPTDCLSSYKRTWLVIRDEIGNTLSQTKSSGGQHGKLLIDDFNQDPTYDEIIYQAYAKSLDGLDEISHHTACYSFATGQPERIWSKPNYGSVEYFYEPENLLVGRIGSQTVVCTDAATGIVVKEIELERSLSNVTFFETKQPTQSLMMTGRLHDTVFVYRFDSPTPVYEPSDKLPTTFRLAQNYPNPFNPSTTIYYEIAEPAQVELTIYNIIGQEVTTLVDQTKPAGRHSVEWNGKDKNGKRVGSGMYLYRLRTDSFSETKKMLLLK